MSGQPALPRGSGPGSREGEGAETLTGHGSPPKGPESTLSSPHKASIWVFSSEAGIRICWQGAGPEWRGQPCDSFPACGAANKGGFLFVPRPRAWVPSDTSVRSSQSSVTAGGQAERVPVRSDGARTGLGEAGRARGGRPPGGGASKQRGGTQGSQRLWETGRSPVSSDARLRWEHPPPRWGRGREQSRSHARATQLLLGSPRGPSIPPAGKQLCGSCGTSLEARLHRTQNTCPLPPFPAPHQLRELRPWRSRTTRDPPAAMEVRWSSPQGPGAGGSGEPAESAMAAHTDWGAFLAQDWAVLLWDEATHWLGLTWIRGKPRTQPKRPSPERLTHPGPCPALGTEQSHQAAGTPAPTRTTRL